MIFAFCVGHDSYDNNSGHRQFAERHADELENAIIWDVDHAPGGIRYIEVNGELVATDETSELYTIANNYTFARIASFYLDKHGFVNTIDEFHSFGAGPAYGISPTNNPWGQLRKHHQVLPFIFRYSGKDYIGSDGACLCSAH